MYQYSEAHASCPWGAASGTASEGADLPEVAKLGYRWWWGCHWAPRDGLLEGAARSEVLKHVGAGRRQEDRSPWPGVLELLGGPRARGGGECVYLCVGAPVGPLHPVHSLPACLPGSGVRGGQGHGHGWCSRPQCGDSLREWGGGAVFWATPLPPLPSPEALTADCRGQAGCLAGFPVRRGLLGPGVPGPPVSSGGLWAGWGRYGLDVRPASTLEARGLGSTCLPYVVLPGGEARTLLVGVGRDTRTVSPGSVTEGLS